MYMCQKEEKKRLGFIHEIPATSEAPKHHARLMNLEAAAERLATKGMRVPKTHATRICVSLPGRASGAPAHLQRQERGVHRKKAQGKKREKLTQSYVRVDGLSGGGVCGLRRVIPISRPALVGEVEDGV